MNHFKNNGATEQEILSISQLNRQSKQLLESNFSQVWIEGEISNFAQPSSGHWYFTLKDEKAQVRCAMFRGMNSRLRFQPEHGMQVLAKVKVSLYEARGDYQLLVQHMEPAGAGALQLAFEQLKAKLAAEGLFDPDKKRDLPEVPQHIGVITSSTGAVLHDILTVLKRRYPLTLITLFPVQVQGKESAAQISKALSVANEASAALEPPLDVLLLARGGGSMEDLWSFNEELVTRSIAASKLPVGSADGHETDFTIADFVADLRAPTPSAAAEILSPDSEEIQQQLVAYEQVLLTTLLRKLNEADKQVSWLNRRLRHPGRALQEQAQRLDDLELRLLKGKRNSLDKLRHKLEQLKAKLLAQTPIHTIARQKQSTLSLAQRAQAAIKTRLGYLKADLQNQMQLLNTVNPLTTVQRGYAIVTDQTGAVIRSYKQLNEGETFTAALAEGALECSVTATNPDNGLPKISVENN